MRTPAIPPILAIVLFSGAALYGSPGPRIRHVKVAGNLRIPAASILHHASTLPGTPFDPAAARADIQKLHRLGLFRSVEVLAADSGEDAVDVTFRVQELPFVSAFAIEGVKGSLERRILEHLRREKLDFKPSMPFQPARGKKAAVAVRDLLRIHKYPNAEVDLVEENQGHTVRIILKVRPGPRLEIGRTVFNGNQSLSDRELRQQMHHTRAGSFWTRWSRHGAYVTEALSSDLERIRDHYRSRGYAAVFVGRPDIEVRSLPTGEWFPLTLGSREREKLQIRIPLVEGMQFQLASVRQEGDAKAAATEVSSLIGSLQMPRRYDFSLLELTRQKILTALGNYGYAFAEVRLEEALDRDAGTVDVVYKIDPGVPITIGEIRFEGNGRLPDKFLRRELITREGDMFDSSKLEKSIERLNRSSIVKRLERTDVSLRMNEEDTLDVIFKVQEKERHGIHGTGGTADSGYLGILYTALNLLGIGESLTLQLDGGAAGSNLLVNLAARHFLGSPFALALSGFHRITNVNVATIVPGPADIVRVLGRRSSGFSLSAGYPLTPAAQLGLAFRMERQSVEAPAGTTQSFAKSEFNPSFTVTSTRGSGATMRSSQFTLSQGFVAETFLRSLDAVRPEVRHVSSRGDPWSGATNSLVMRTQASAIRPLRGKPLPLAKRFFPGDEIVRGFRDGALSSWSHIPEGDSSAVRPAGADTVAGASLEYRVPIHGALSSAAFMDLGWTRLDGSRIAEESGRGARLIERTNGLLRASAGGELRLQLPIIQQPARLIFGWNPLRLDTLIQSTAGPLRLADPRGVIRFALGMND